MTPLILKITEKHKLHPQVVIDIIDHQEMLIGTHRLQIELTLPYSGSMIESVITDRDSVLELLVTHMALKQKPAEKMMDAVREFKNEDFKTVNKDLREVARALHKYYHSLSFKSEAEYVAYLEEDVILNKKEVAKLRKERSA